MPGETEPPFKPEPSDRPFYPALDGLRAIAVLMVFCQHYLNTIPALNWGWAGVDVFFVLSGFLITGILYDSRDTVHRFRRFYMRRALRIFPLYYGVLALGLALTPLFHWVWHPAWYLWPVYLGNYARFIWLQDPLFAAGAVEHLRSTLDAHPPLFLYLGHFWSLCVEEQFYLVWPLVVFSVNSRERLRNICFALCVMALAGRIACAVLLPPAYVDAEILYRITPLRADSLLIGAALALMLRGPEAARLKALAAPGLTLFAAGFATFSLCYFCVKRQIYAPAANDPVLATIGYTLIDLWSGAIIVQSLHAGSTLHRLLIAGPLRGLGRISYGFYVFHDIPHLLYLTLAVRVLAPLTGAPPRLLGSMVAFYGTLVLARLSFRYLETPILRWKDRYAPEPDMRTLSGHGVVPAASHSTVFGQKPSRDREWNRAKCPTEASPSKEGASMAMHLSLLPEK